jgi:flavin-dependent dehydrogenase
MGTPALESGSRVAVVGAGPAGAFFSYFLLDMAERAEVALEVDVYEPRDFTRPAPAGCNMCGGIISESLVQMLSAEGINLPARVVQRGIDSYVLHTDVGRVQVRTPVPELRIGAVHRGGGPRDVRDSRWSSFDGFLLNLAVARGAKLIPARVDGLEWDEGRPRVSARGFPSKTYDLLVGALGVNTGALKLFEDLHFGFRPPRTTRAFIAEFHLGQELVTRQLGSSMHVFLLNLPRLEFAALVPKGDYVTMCLLGHDIDEALVKSFLHHREVRRCFPPGWGEPVMACHCAPRMYLDEATHPFADRVVLIGDCSVSRLYKNGIGAAYRTAKACAVTALFDGISADDFRRSYWQVCERIAADNSFGEAVFSVVSLFKIVHFISRAMINMARNEQIRPAANHRSMSLALWNTFTGSADYRDIFLRALRPSFLATLTIEVTKALTPAVVKRRVLPALVRKGHTRMREALRARAAPATGRASPRLGELGKIYSDGEVISQKGDTGDCMYVILAGLARVYASGANGEIWLRDLGPGDTFGESAIFRRTRRSATVRAAGETRILSLNRRQFLSSARDDPTFAFRVLEQMSNRVRLLTDEVVRLNAALARETSSVIGEIDMDDVGWWNG